MYLQSRVKVSYKKSERQNWRRLLLQNANRVKSDEGETVKQFEGKDPRSNKTWMGLKYHLLGGDAKNNNVLFRFFVTITFTFY